MFNSIFGFFVLTNKLWQKFTEVQQLFSANIIVGVLQLVVMCRNDCCDLESCMGAGGVETRGFPAGFPWEWVWIMLNPAGLAGTGLMLRESHSRGNGVKWRGKSRGNCTRTWERYWSRFSAGPSIACFGALQSLVASKAVVNINIRFVAVIKLRVAFDIIRWSWIKTRFSIL